MTQRTWIRPMEPRDPNEPHRAATPLELLFDLSFVVAIAIAAGLLHHGLSAAHVWEAIQGYVLVFFAIWWAWMGFTWFASAYDADDVPYRLKTFTQIAGVLVLAAGIPRAFEDRDFTYIVAGYVIMRAGLVALWVRAGRSDRARRTTAYRYATGITVLQIFWVGMLWVPEGLFLVGWVVLVICELLVPAWAERAEPTTWHPHHISERYGLMALIVIGESILASTIAIQKGVDAGGLSFDLIAVALGGLLIIFSMWWVYFGLPGHSILHNIRLAFLWGYGHCLVFGSAAAVGAGLGVNVDAATDHAVLSGWPVGLCVAVPASVFVGTLALLFGNRLIGCVTSKVLLAVSIPSLLGAAALPHPVLAIGIVLVLLTIALSRLVARRAMT